MLTTFFAALTLFSSVIAIIERRRNRQLERVLSTLLHHLEVSGHRIRVVTDHDQLQITEQETMR